MNKPVRNLIKPSLLALTTLLPGIALASNTHVVLQKDKDFSQKEITVKAGDKIRFENMDSVSHNVYSLSRVNGFQIEHQDPGEFDEVEFATAGATEVNCAFHPSMKLRVRVVD